MKKSTIRVEQAEHIKICKAAEKEGIPALVRYIPFVLSESLPLKEIRKYKKKENSKIDRVALYIPDDIHQLIKQTLEDNSTRFHKYTLQDVVITALDDRIHF